MLTWEGESSEQKEKHHEERDHVIEDLFQESYKGWRSEISPGKIQKADPGGENEKTLHILQNFGLRLATEGPN